MTQWPVTGIRWTARESRCVSVWWLSGWTGWSFRWEAIVFFSNLSETPVNEKLTFRRWLQGAASKTATKFNLLPLICGFNDFHTIQSLPLLGFQWGVSTLHSLWAAFSQPRLSIWENIRRLTPEGDGPNLNFYCHFTPVVLVIFGLDTEASARQTHERGLNESEYVFFKKLVGSVLWL